MSKIHLDIEMGETSAASMLDFFHQQFELEIKKLPEPTKTLLLDLRNTIRKLESQISGKSEASLGNFLMTTITIPSSNGNDHSEGKKYDPHVSRFENALYAMYRIGRLVTTREMINLWLKEDPTLLERDGLTMGAMQGKVSSTLKQKTDQKKKIYRIKSDFSDEYLYGLVEWFDENWEPKKEYFPEGFRRLKIFSTK